MKHYCSLFSAMLFALVMFGQAPSNDLCANAIDINEIFSAEVGAQLVAGPFSNEDATGEPELASDLTGSWFDPMDGETLPSVDQSVWFRFTGNGETYQLMTFSGPDATMYANDTQAALYSGTCEDLTLVTANDDLNGLWNGEGGWYYSVLNFTTEVDVDYWLMVDGFNWQDGDNYQGVSQGTFNLRAMNAEPLSQRGVCSSARPIDELFGGTTDATNYIGPFDDTELVTGLGVDYEADMIGTECWGDATDDGSVWFSFVGDGQSYYLGMDQCQANNQTFVYYFGWDNQLALYKGTDCGELEPVACAEDYNFDENNFWAEIGFDSEEGVQYYLRHDGYHYNVGVNEWSAEGTFCLSATRSSTLIGIDELKQVALDVFPNPSVGGNVSLSWPGSESVADVSVFDLTGRQVAGLRQVVRNDMVNLGLPAGTYVLKMRTAMSSSTTQLQVVR